VYILFLNYPLNWPFLGSFSLRVNDNTRNHYGQDIIIKHDMILKVTYKIDYAIHFNLFSANKFIYLYKAYLEIFIMRQYVSHRVMRKMLSGNRL